MDKKKILVIGQTPPPYGGQAIMIKYMLDGEYTDIEMFHVRMCFSKQFDELGHVQINKLFHLFEVIKNTWVSRFKYGAKTLYYPLSGATNSSLIRDFVILICTRFLFEKTIYHFHAAGISDYLPRKNILVRFLCYSVFKRPDLSITSSEYNPKDAEYLKSKSIRIIPLGIPDLNKNEERIRFGNKGKLKILFMGLLNSTKGEEFILDAIFKVRETGRNVELHIAGCFESDDYEYRFMTKVKEYDLENFVFYHGIVSGEEKKNLFLECDVFCFPSFFIFESFGIVLLEAMMFQMPIIASRWRGIQSIVDDGNNGYLVDVKNSDQIAASIISLYDDRSLLEKMARCGRRHFVERYEISKYLRNIEKEMYRI